MNIDNFNNMVVSYLSLKPEEFSGSTKERLIDSQKFLSKQRYVKNSGERYNIEKKKTLMMEIMKTYWISVENQNSKKNIQDLKNIVLGLSEGDFYHFNKFSNEELKQSDKNVWLMIDEIYYYKSDNNLIVTIEHNNFDNNYYVYVGSFIAEISNNLSFSKQKGEEVLKKMF